MMSLIGLLLIFILLPNQASSQIVISPQPYISSTGVVSGVLSTSGVNTFSLAALAAGPATVGNTGTILVNPTASLVGTQAQWSPPLQFVAHGWDIDSVVDNQVDCYWTLRPIPANNVTSQMQLMCQIASGGYNQSLTVTNVGNVTIPAGQVYNFAGRTAIASTADGLFKIAQNSGATVAVELNSGTAVPTVANCSVSTTGTITAHSTNVSGEVNPGSGSTSCDVVFGLPNWSFAPYCVITNETTGSNPGKITARSTTGFTVTTLTAGDKFTYVCVGGGV